LTSDRTYYLSPSEALELGVIDEVVGLWPRAPRREPRSP
jgi:ATP-dependent protease ClpP protease subunit